MSESTDELVQGVLETIDTAKTHRIRLQEALDSLHEAKTQVLHTLLFPVNHT